MQNLTPLFSTFTGARKKFHGHLLLRYLLRKLSNAGNSFYRSDFESVLTSSITAWYGLIGSAKGGEIGTKDHQLLLSIHPANK